MPVTSGRPGAWVVRAVALGGPLLGGAVGLALPGDAIVGGVAWLAFLLGSFAGWGGLAARLARAGDADLGLRMAWGAAAYLAVAGYLLAMGVLTAPVQLALLIVGAGVHVALGLRAAARGEAEGRPAAPALGGWPLALVGLLAAIVAVDVVMAIVKVRSNVYDDEIAYRAFIERLLQVGDLDEPFSWRRISTYGGHTILAAAGVVRGGAENLHLVDAALFRLIALGLVVGLAAERGADRVITATLLLVLALLPDSSINLSSHWTGAAMFLALYRTAARAGRTDGPRAWALVGVLASASATLRQNHVLIAGLVAIAALAFLGRGRRPRAAAMIALGGLVVIAPYAIASWRTCGTPMYPLLGGGANPHIIQAGEARTWWHELHLLVRMLVEPAPLWVLLPLLPAVLSIRDRRAGRPLTALAIATLLGVVAQVHGFTISDPSNLWRYSFGFVTAWIVAATIELGAAGDERAGGEVSAPPMARLIAVIALLIQLAVTGPGMVRTYAPLGRDLAAARTGDGALRSLVAARYRRMQAAAPAGVRLAVAVDEPYLLDYRRQRVVNIDTPAYVSEGAAWPSFAGAEALATYLQGHGVRYLAFVRGDRSRYAYRRQFWVLRAFFEGELLRVTAAYTVDFIDSAHELARTRAVLFEEEGLVLVDLGTRNEGEPAADAAPLTREAFVRGLAEREGLIAAWGLMSRADLQFEDGLTAMACVDAEGRQRVVELGVDCMTGAGTPVRWMSERGHLRVHGRGRHRLVVEGRVEVAEIFTRPQLSVIVGGTVRWSQAVAADGTFAPEVELDADGWHDVYLSLSSIGDPWRASSKLGLARLVRVRWEPVAP